MADESTAPASWRDAAPPARRLLASVARALLGAALLLLAYFMLPLTADSVGLAAFAIVAVGVAGFVALFLHELTKIDQAENPGLRGLESLAFVATLFVVIFSAAYVVMSQSFPASFSSLLSKMDALYFTVTVLTTVGFGDIHAVTGSARALVTIQMVLDLVLIGVAVRLLLSTAKRAAGQRHRPLPPGE